MVILEVCRSEPNGCPNALISTAAWKSALEDWLLEKAISERLRRRVPGGHILHHHKLRMSISACPNACSRPQIADVGLVGFVRPVVAPDTCTLCGSCEAACPDSAIRVHEAPPEFNRAACQGCFKCRDACPVGCITHDVSGVRVLLGGKLGRHPRLARMVAEETEPSAAIRRIDDAVGRYLEHARPDERFSDFLVRTGDGATPR